ncbi:Probable ATP-dependent RNA helicase kurz [Strongyloides ratti]|uniref:RNA helicase n=1 Tax=Strongyloides ratti TaxID=34506 RepID=A0A090LHV5_STRRB|nr:Probable ATP-dependent RNA helicase kurz [Strongyloides ratti]CEF67100.1 Probable ATP-dependent RNA helicase kurz [Strongyloides ratti]
MDRKRKQNNDDNVNIIDSSNDVEYEASHDISNSIILSSKSKKKKVTEPCISTKKLSRKKVEMQQKYKEKKLANLSKTKKKKLARVAARKEEKINLENLFSELQQYQSQSGNLSLITSSMDAKRKKDDTKFPSKVKSIDKDVLKKWENDNDREQKDFFETDSSSDDEDVEEEMKQFFNKLNQKKENQVIKEECNTDTSVEKNNSVTKEKIKPNEKEDLSPIVGPKIAVNRLDSIQAQRSSLPIFAEEQEIVESINDNMVTIICGETGSGKTTQIPQFLYEAGYTSKGHLIGITEPRRVAAMSMASRVGIELNDTDLSSYQIRFEGNRNIKTRILFMTDGVLMRELQQDIMLSKFSVIIIDEAHERSMYSDILIGILSRIVPLRSKKGFPLKLIIMSATLQLEDFMQKHLFPTIEPKIIKVETRQFPVTIHFEKNTPNDFCDATFKKVCQIHEKLPPGAILVFVSGQIDVERIIRKLKERYPISNKRRKFQTKNLKKVKDETNPDIDEFGVNDAACFDEHLDDEIISEKSTEIHPPPPDSQPLYCLPLYSLLSTEKQKRIFNPIPEKSRLCIVATNVAETSITIPNIKYVIDSGKEKRKEYDVITGVNRFVVTWCSQASANQRSGRAGRVQAGHAYRLYSSAVFQGFDKFSMPEILNKPTDQLVLHLKSMNIVKVINFPFVTKPEADQLEMSEQKLVKMGALSVELNGQVKEAKITKLGRTLAALPLSPEYGKMLIMANQKNLFNYAITLAAILSVREPLISLRSIKGKDNENTMTLIKQELVKRYKLCSSGQSKLLGDITLLLKLMGAALYGKWNQKECEKMGLRYKAFLEAKKMRKQLIKLVNTNSDGVIDGGEINVEDDLEPPSEIQCKQLRQILVSCLPERIARKVEGSDNLDQNDIPKGAYYCQKLEEYVFIDPSSMVYKSQPEYVLYQEIVQTSEKRLMTGCCVVDGEWISLLAPEYCSFYPFENKDSLNNKDEVEIYKYNEKLGTVVEQVKCFFSPHQWNLGVCERPLPVNIVLYKFFAYHILEGNVLKPLKNYKEYLLAQPSSLLKNWAKLQERTEAFINKLIEREVYQKSKLISLWKNGEREYLLEEYLMWLPESIHDKVALEWPPIEE